MCGGEKQIVVHGVLSHITRVFFVLQDISPLDLRTSTAVESLLSLRGSCGASGGRMAECQWRPPSPAPSTSSERSVAAGASPTRQDATPQSLARSPFQGPSTSHLYSPPPMGGFTLGADGRVVSGCYPHPSTAPPSIVRLSFSHTQTHSLSLSFSLTLFSRVGKSVW